VIAAVSPAARPGRGDLWEKARPRPGRAAFPARPLAAALAALLACACQPPAPAGKAAPAAGPAGKASYEAVLRDTDAAIASTEASLKDPIDSALVPLELVGVYADRARLTGSYDDYAKAEQLLARLEPKFAGTEGFCLAQARLHYALHRLAKARAALDRCPRIAGGPDALRIRADLAFYTGRYAEAGQIYRALVNQLGTPQSYIQLGLYAAKTGAPGEAAAFLEAAEKRYHGGSATMHSWLALQRGLIELDRGRYEQARALFALADERLPGYWLNEEHLAEAAGLLGDTAAEKRILEQVIRKTDAPEYLDALAGLEAQAGDAEAARKLLARAEAVYAERARRFPEAIAGHALDHYLDASPQPQKALGLAEANFRNRPHGDAAIALAKAYLLNRRPGDAARLLESELAKGWDTAETWWVLSLAARAAGNAARAEAAAREAQRRNPNSATQYAFDF
jgi:tetratricopeptide (TPR) repeat protein